jgi:hypothetical protein
MSCTLRKEGLLALHDAQLKGKKTDDGRTASCSNLNTVSAHGMAGAHAVKPAKTPGVYIACRS